MSPRTRLLLGVPVVVVDGRFRLPDEPAPSICHGYACGCACKDCEEREHAPIALQPWGPRPTLEKENTMMTNLAEAVAAARADIAAMPQVLLELEVVSHGRTMRLDGTRGAKDPTPILSVDPEPYPHELFKERWDRATTAPQRARVLADARACLDALRKAPPLPDAFLEPGSYQWKVRIASDFTTPIGELARVNGTTRNSIRAWRERYGVTSDRAGV